MGPMDRRGFLAGAGMGTSYGLSVDARRFFGGKTGSGGAPGPDDGAPPTEALAPAAEGRPREEPHMRVLEHEVDVFVAGGGMSGVCAALAAARNGARVLLVQDRSRLGGNASSEIRMHIVGADCHGSRAGWREGGLIEEIRLEDAVRNPHRAWELFDLTLYDLCMREPNLRLLLDTSIYSVDMEGDSIARVRARCDKTETIHQVTAGVYCDCTGDARLGLEAGAAFRTGREGRDEFGEELAQEAADNLSQGSSILFTARKHDRAIPYAAPPWARKITEDDLLFRGIPKGSYEYGFWWIELGGVRDVIRDNEELRHELLRVVLGVWDWIKNSGQRPDSSHWALESVGMIPGKRESRRLEGPHVQTQQDLEGGWRERNDGIAIGGWNFDDHPPGGFDDWDKPPYAAKRIPDAYNIAFESVYSRNVPNLMMAGRNISNSHVAFSSTRVMATCSVIGQAVGTAAALCGEKGVTPRVLRREHMGELQQRLLRDDQSIRGVRNEDPEDLARRARATASVGGPGEAAGVLDGEVRDLPGEWTHRFGVEAKHCPVDLDLTWTEPQRLSRVQLTFDSGFHRELTLSGSDGVTARTVRGPQPETVRDYELWADVDGEEQLLLRVEGNYQRLRRHGFEAVETSRLRLRVLATQGSDHVRVYEVRCYA